MVGFADHRFDPLEVVYVGPIIRSGDDGCFKVAMRGGFSFLIDDAWLAIDKTKDEFLQILDRAKTGERLSRRLNE